MINFVKNNAKTLMFALVVGATTLLGKVAGATDPANLSEALASTTSMVSDQRGAILTFIIGLATVVIVVMLLKVGIGMALRWIKRAFTS